MKTIIKIVLVVCLVSCGRNAEEQKAVNKNVQEALEVVQELPTIQKEVKAYEEKLTQQKVTGSFEATMDNKALNINS